MNNNNCPHNNIESNMCPDTCKDCGKVLIEPNDPPSPLTVEERFDELVNEVRRETHWGDEIDSPNHYFGHKTQRKINCDPNDDGMELFTITDFGNIKKFIQKEISSAVTQALKEERELVRSIVEEKRIEGDNARDWNYVNACEEIAEELKKL